MKLLVIVIGAAIAGLGYLTRCFHRREMEIARMRRGLRKYVLRTPPVISL